MQCINEVKTSVLFEKGELALAYFFWFFTCEQYSPLPVLHTYVVFLCILAVLGWLKTNPAAQYNKKLRN